MVETKYCRLPGTGVQRTGNPTDFTAFVNQYGIDLPLENIL